MMNKILLSILISLILLGCNERNVIPDNYYDKSISILSAFPEKLPIKYIGFLVTSNNFGSMDVSHWKLNDYIENETIELLKASAKYNIVKKSKAVDRGIYSNYMPYSATSFFEHDARKEQVQALAKLNNTEQVMIINTNVLSDHSLGPPGFVNDYGIIQRNFEAFTYVTIQILIYDAINGEEVARNKGYLKIDREIDPNLEETAKLSDEQLANTKIIIFSMTENLIKTTLNKLGIN